jgi:hypothetical protein
MYRSKASLKDVGTAERLKMSVRSRCAAAWRCTTYEVLAGRNGKRRRCGNRVWGVPFEESACGNVTCCEDYALMHARECEVKVQVVQRSVPHMC